jgi:hypothetical protein
MPMSDASSKACRWAALDASLAFIMASANHS